MIGGVRSRTVLASALCVGGGALLLPLGLRAILPVPEALYPLLFLAYFAGAALMTVVVAMYSWIALWPATPYLDLVATVLTEPRGAEPREAKAAALAFPARVATAAVVAGELVVAAGWLALTVAGTSPGLALGLSLTTAIVVALGWLLLYALAAHAVAPLWHRLHDVPYAWGQDRPGRRSLTHFAIGTTLRGRLAYALWVVIIAGVVPAAVFSTHYLDRAYRDGEQERVQRTAGWLLKASQNLEPRRARELVEAVPLMQGVVGSALGLGPDRPRPQAIPLPGGQTVYLPHQDVGEQPLGMLLVLAALLLLTTGVALGLGQLVSQDVLGLIARVHGATNDPSSPPGPEPEQPPKTQEVQQATEALDRLLNRMRRLQIDSYLTIERTIDSRRAKSQFLASMSHDLRSPLSSILGFSELLINGYEGDIPEAARRRLLRMHKTGRRLLKLLSEILDTAKVESQTIELHPRRCTATELLSQAVAEARRGRLNEDLPVVMDVMPGLRPIYVDPLRFPQALAHLIGHVLDGAEASAQKLYIAAREGQSAERGLTFEVDVAIEREPGATKEPFLPLGTVGLGLALPLARRLIALHGGTIDVIADPFTASGEARPGLRAVVPMRIS